MVPLLQEEKKAEQESSNLICLESTKSKNCDENNSVRKLEFTHCDEENSLINTFKVLPTIEQEVIMTRLQDLQRKLIRITGEAGSTTKVTQQVSTDNDVMPSHSNLH